LEGEKPIDLRGMSKEQLLKELSPPPPFGKGRSTNIEETLQLAKGSVENLKNKKFVAINTRGDGNCFLNAYALYLGGEYKEEEYALRLRVALALDLIKFPTEFGISGTEEQQIEELIAKLGNYDYGITRDSSFLEVRDVTYMSRILQRPLRTVFTADIPSVIVETGGIVSHEEYDPEIVNSFISKEFFTSWRQHNHFTLLIPKEADILDTTLSLPLQLRVE